MTGMMTGKDPAVQWLIGLGKPSTPTAYDETCYICNDKSYAQAGLPVCRACPECGGHVAADDGECSHCEVTDEA